MSDTLKPIVIGGDKIAGETSIEELDELQYKLQNVVGRAKEVEIIDRKTYNEAVELLQKIDESFKIIESVIERFRKPAYDYYKSVLAEKKRILAPGKEARETIREKLTSYKLEQERRAKEKRQKKLKAAKQEKLKKLQQEFENALENGDEEKAEEIMEEISSGVSADVPDVDDTSESTEHSDIHYREVWRVELESDKESAMKKLCQAVVNGDIDWRYVLPNEKKLNRLASQLQSEFNVPGVKAMRKVYPVRNA